MTDELKKRARRLEQTRTGCSVELPEEPELGEDEVVATPIVPMSVGYVTLAEANQYVSSNYIVTDEVRIRWEQLDNDSKRALLLKSFQVIELLPFVGQKTSEQQAFQFPRCPSTEVPWQIKAAQIENALSKGDSETDEDTKFYERLWTWGVQSYTLGKLSEKVSAGGFGSGPWGTAQQTGITSANAMRLLRPFLMGGYSIA